MVITRLNDLIEALAGARSLNQILLSNRLKGPRVQKIKDLCRERNLIFRFVPKSALDRKAGRDHQGVYAEVSPVRFIPLPRIIQNAARGLLVILHNIFDPHNMGAIIRSCTAAGVDGIIVSQKKTAPVNETVLKVSAGTLLKAKLVSSKRILDDIRTLKQAGFWIVGAEAAGGVPYHDYDFTEKTALLLGNESKGISPNLNKNTDQTIHIPLSADVESLNVSVACGIILFEANRQLGLFHGGQDVRP
jgi:23S rRNA (guanosine2251-2'-O)-methyltransferase